MLCNTLIRLGLIAAVPVALFAANVDDDLRMLAERYETSVEPRVVAINKEYKARLEALQRRALAENDLTTAVAIRDELKALDLKSARPVAGPPVVINFATPGTGDKPAAPVPASEPPVAPVPNPPSILADSGVEKLKAAVAGRKGYWYYWNGGEKPAPIVFNEDGSIGRPGANILWRWQIASPTEFRLLLRHDGKDFGYRAFDFDPATGAMVYNKVKSTRIDVKPCRLAGPDEAAVSVVPSREAVVDTPFGRRVKEAP